MPSARRYPRHVSLTISYPNGTIYIMHTNRNVTYINLGSSFSNNGRNNFQNPRLTVPVKQAIRIIKNI